MNIEKIFHMMSYFPIFVLHEDNRTLLDEVTQVKLEKVLHRFKKDKNLGSRDGQLNSSIGLIKLFMKTY